MSAPWRGDNPYFLMIYSGTGGFTVDLDEPQWATIYAKLMRAPGAWYLFSKVNALPCLGIIVLEGEQPYYTARHIGIASGVDLEEKAEIIAYGIGKKRLDGHVDRLWILPNGIICAGDDVEKFAIKAIKGE